jgi:hypothetical protein
MVERSVTSMFNSEIMQSLFYLYIQASRPVGYGNERTGKLRQLRLRELIL